jgi:hypothetical protein
MKRPDMFDYFGGILIVIVLAMWIAHIILPPLPPEPPGPPGSIGAPPALPGAIGKGRI